MSIIINIRIRPEAQADLTRQAAAHSIQAEGYAATLLDQTVHLLDRTLQELGQFLHKIPLLPDEAFTREGLYQDYD